jgi:stringent starvation protein B
LPPLGSKFYISAAHWKRKRAQSRYQRELPRAVAVDEEGEADKTWILMSDSAANQVPEEYKKFTDFLLKIAFRATNDLRKHLEIDELNFRFAAPFAQRKS